LSFALFLVVVLVILLKLLWLALSCNFYILLSFYVFYGKRFVHLSGCCNGAI